MRSDRLLFFMASSLVIFCAWWLQGLLVLNSDSAWLIEAASRLLAGGNYQNNFFEVNPPMILYVYVPILYLQQLLHSTIQNSVNLCLFALAALDIFFAVKALKNSTLSTNSQRCFLLMLIFCLLILPYNEFSQREHIALLLVLPVLFTHNPTKWNATNLLVGLMAGIGFAIKPYFLIVFILHQAYYIYLKPNLQTAVSAFNLAVVLVMMVYLVSIYIFHQDYLQIILPFAAKFYYQAYRSSPAAVILNAESVYICLSALAVILCWHELKKIELLKVLLLAELGFYLAYLVQGMHWYYHIYPALALCLLGNVLCCATFFDRIAASPNRLAKFYFFCFMLLLFYYHYSPLITNSFYYYPIVNFLFLFFVTLTVLEFLTITFIATLCVGVYLTTLDTILYPYVFWLVVSLWWLLVMACSANKMKNNMLFLLVNLLFAYPCYFLCMKYSSVKMYNQQYAKLVTALKEYPTATSFYFFTDSDQFSYPALTYNSQVLGSRFSCLGGLPRLTVFDDASKYRSAYDANRAHLSNYIQMIVDDFAAYHPQYVLVDIRQPSEGLRYYGDTQINYLQLFSLYQPFAELWKNYRYEKILDGQPLYKFQVYKKI